MTVTIDGWQIAICQPLQASAKKQIWRSTTKADCFRKSRIRENLQDEMENYPIYMQEELSNVMLVFRGVQNPGNWQLTWLVFLHVWMFVVWLLLILHCTSTKYNHDMHSIPLDRKINSTDVPWYFFLHIYWLIASILRMRKNWESIHIDLIQLQGPRLWNLSCFMPPLSTLLHTPSLPTCSPTRATAAAVSSSNSQVFGGPMASQNCVFPQFFHGKILKIQIKKGPRTTKKR